MKVADVDAGARKFGRCAACHTIGKGGPDTGGPNLYGVFGQALGQHRPRYGYTVALSTAGGRWDAQTLDAWIANPQKLVAGTKMQVAGMVDPLDRADIIAYLRSQSD
ncbi:c-type cytochrome [Sphingomonas sp. KC8]|uniref:c-type cytochrome n=1 Tax=Sphingomonas sp. KC8 TaxID=1030157 RepID=UPI000248AB0B|nr:c-type cytochrome [Sphingomonas sp. KC8]ARS28101.1 cytochrome C [Sphingomonas sp. KC8]